VDSTGVLQVRTYREYVAMLVSIQSGPRIDSSIPFVVFGPHNSTKSNHSCTKQRNFLFLWLFSTTCHQQSTGPHTHGLIKVLFWYEKKNLEYECESNDMGTCQYSQDFLSSLYFFDVPNSDQLLLSMHQNTLKLKDTAYRIACAVASHTKLHQ
jgi:hypothetical protein